MTEAAAAAAAAAAGGMANVLPPYEALAGVARWNAVALPPKLGTGEWMADALGPTDEEYNESVLWVGDGGL